MASITYNKKLLEAAEIMGIDASVAIGCLYQIQKRGEPIDDLRTLTEEVNKYQKQSRECTICLCNNVDSLFLPCRFVIILINYQLFYLFFFYFRHSAACLECANLIRASSSNSCPICREAISDVLQIFIS